ncbi:MAG TPA: anti-sigma factor [Thermoanaerobaculia bacterium]|nr:anti-sigma factor [Thermoanaerobaculia bacterium]
MHSTEMHPSEEDLQALIDGELGERDSERLRAHLEECASCRSRRQELESALREAGELLASLDGSPPALSADEVIREAEQRRATARVSPRERAASRQSSGPSRRVLWAASLAGLVVAGVVAAAVIPGSPLRDAIEEIAGGSDAAAPSPETAPDIWSAQAGVALVPGRELEIRFEANQTEGSIELLTVPGDTARVDVRSDSVGFVVGGGSILVKNRGATASYRISLPENLPTARIIIGPRTVYHHIDDEVLQDAIQRARERGTIPFR